MGEGGGVDGRGSGRAQDRGASMERGAGREDVVDDDVTSTGVDSLAALEAESFGDVAQPFGTVQAGLRFRGGMFLEEWCDGAARNVAGEARYDTLALVVATGPRFLRMERNGHEDGPSEVTAERLIGGGGCHQVIGQVGRPLVFDAVEDVSDRPLGPEGTNRSVKGGV